MIAVIQRVKQASVSADNRCISSIGNGFLVLLGVSEGDTEKEAWMLAKKTAGLRVFSDEEGKMNKSVLDIDGEIMVVSNFTLCADCSHGRRPSFIRAADAEKAELLYAFYADALLDQGVKQVGTGIFGADMDIALVNDGPVTILLDTEKL